MKNLTLLCCLFSFYLASSQSFEWLQTPEIPFNLNPSGLGYPVTADHSGNVYMAGFKENPYLYNDVMGTVFINKYQNDGTLLQSKTFTGKAIVYDMATDLSGNLVVAAGYLDAFSFDALSITTSNQDVQFLLLKMDAQGNLLWHYEIPPPNGIFLNDFHGVTTDSSGNIYLGFDDYGDSWVQKLSPQGALLQTITQLNVKLVTSISVDNAGNIYTAGGCAEINATYAGVPNPAPFQYNTYVCKYDASGQFQWIKYIEDVTCPHPQVKARSPEEVYFSSYLFGNYAFDGLTAEGPVMGGFTDFFVSRLNASGQFQWMREVPGNGAAVTGQKNYLETDAQGNVYFAGATHGSINWGGNFTTSVPGFSDDALLLKYDPAGNILMAMTAGGAWDDRTDGIAVNDSGDIFLSGMATGNASFGLLSHAAPEFGRYPFLSRITNSALGSANQDKVPNIVYPNPSQDFLYTNENNTSDAVIFNMLGQKVKELQFGSARPADIRELPSGTYLLVVAGRQTFRLVKN